MIAIEQFLSPALMDALHNSDNELAVMQLRMQARASVGV
jgi:hypothetical protein